MHRRYEITKYNFPIALFIAVMFIGTAACAATFKGKVIDSDTKEPIEGAVVVASWNEERADIAGSTSEFKDVKETLTNKSGEWIIKGPRGREMGNITAIFTFLTRTYITNPPKFIIFKPGYCSWPAGFFIDACKGKIKPVGNDKIADGETVELPKLINREDRRRAKPTPVGEKEDWKKQKQFIKLIREEWQFLTSKEPGDLYMWEDRNEK